MVRKLLPHLLLAIALLLVAGCDTVTQAPPQITVVITAVDDTTALADGVAEALTGTAQVYIAATETELAFQGIRPSETLTLTPSMTFTPSPTTVVTATRTPTPTITLSPTFAPYPSYTPAVDSQESTGFGWIRVLNASRQRVETGLDIYINDIRIARSLLFQGGTTYQQAPVGAVRVSLQTVDVGVAPQINATMPPPLLTTVVNVTENKALSLVIVDNKERALELVSVVEDTTPLASGVSRLTIMQANPFLLQSNILIPDTGRALAYEITPGTTIGPMDIESGNHPIEFYDSDFPDQLYARLDSIEFADRVDYLLIFIAAELESNDPTDYLLFTNPNRRIETDLGVRFINSYTVPTTLILDDQPILTNLPVGATSPVIPVSRQGGNLIIQTVQGERLFAGSLGPWQSDELTADKTILMYPNPNPNAGSNPNRIVINDLSQNVPPTAIRANLRLIHALPGTVGLSLQIRPALSVTQGDSPLDWITIAGSDALQSSPYVGRTPGLYDLRVVLQGAAGTILGRISNVDLLAGGVYDFIIVPGNDIGSTRLQMVEPEVQFTSIGINEGDPEVVIEAVGATLTAMAPEVTATPTTFFTATATITPVPTNTPRPTNTPDAPPPSIAIIPAPPNTARTTVSVSGQDFAPNLNYTIGLNDRATALVAGRTAEDGTINNTVTLPGSIEPGWYTLIVCVDCRVGGAQQQAVAALHVAADNMTPTVTPAP